MKNIKYLFLLLCTIFVFEMISFNKAEADVCSTDADGVVEEDDIDNGCDFLPNLYEIVIYKLYLCTSIPTEPTTTSTVDLTPCSEIFNNPDGATASVTQGTEINLSGTYTKPPAGTYTHGYAYMDNTFGITWAGEIEASMTGQTGGTGVFCATVAGAGTHKVGSSLTASSICSATDNLTPGKHVETMQQFGGSGDDFAPKAEADIAGTNASIKGYLVDANEHLGANTNEIVKLEGLVVFGSPVVITTETTSLSMKFNVAQGMHLHDAGSNKLQIGSGPFQAIMTAN